MKTTWKLIMLLFVAALGIVSCQDDVIDDLDGVYTHPTVCDYNTLESQSRDKEGTLFKYTLNLSDGGSNTLNLIMYSTEYALPSTDFTPSDSAANKTYLIGEGGSTCNGQSFDGSTISVSVSDSNYVMEGILYLADSSVVRMTGGFSVVYEYIPTYTYRVEMETPVLDGDDVEIAGAGKFKIYTYADGVQNAYFEVIADSTATSLAGTYSISEPISATGQAATGYYLDYAWWGYAGVIFGGCYYIEDGDTLYIRSGDLTIAETDGLWSISGENLGILDVETLAGSNGATWTTTATPGAISVTEANEAMSTVVSAIAYSDGTAYSSYVTFATSSIIATYYPDYYFWGYTGNGTVVALQLYGANAASLEPGTYSIVSSASATTGDIVAGYDAGGYYAGTTVVTVVDDVSTTLPLTDGTVEVIADGDNLIVLINAATDSGTVKTSYYGTVPITVY